MGAAKIAISLERKTLLRLDRLVKRGAYPSRSKAIQKAVEERLDRQERGRLARECGKLDPRQERALAEEGMARDVEQWPGY